jgi:hypothetical protein
MIGRRAIAGLAVLWALMSCALAAQGASAAEAKNTTSFTCVENGGNKDFADAHCTENVEAGKGKFGHVEIPVNKTTEVSLTNEKTAEKNNQIYPRRLQRHRASHDAGNRMYRRPWKWNVRKQRTTAKRAYG